jgi:hypothetical protein
MIFVFFVVRCGANQKTKLFCGGGAEDSVVQLKIVWFSAATVGKYVVASPVAFFYFQLCLSFFYLIIKFSLMAHTMHA